MVPLDGAWLVDPEEVLDEDVPELPAELVLADGEFVLELWEPELEVLPVEVEPLPELEPVLPLLPSGPLDEELPDELPVVEEPLVPEELPLESVPGFTTELPPSTLPELEPLVLPELVVEPEVEESGGGELLTFCAALSEPPAIARVSAAEPEDLAALREWACGAGDPEAAAADVGAGLAGTTTT